MPKDKASIYCVRYPIVKPMWKFKYVICVTLLSFFTGISDQLGAKRRNNRLNRINVTRCKFFLFSSLKFVMQVYSSRIFDKRFKVIYIIPVKIQFTSCVRSCISHSDNVIRPRHAPHALHVVTHVWSWRGWVQSKRLAKKSFNQNHHLRDWNEFVGHDLGALENYKL